MPIDLLQKQRFEYKYIVDEITAKSIRDFVSGYLEPDAYGATQPEYSYPVHSLYMDSPGLKTYMDTINGERNRYKLRIRYYENGKDAPVFFEVKRRFNQIIAKKRAKVRRSSVEKLAHGFLPDTNDLYEFSPENAESMALITNLINQINAQPQVHVSYLREAWMRNDWDNSVRVTFDRGVRTESFTELSLSTEMRDWVDVFGNQVILELKFTDRFPLWFKEMVQVFNLRQQSAAKYVDGLIHLGLNRKMAVKL